MQVTPEQPAAAASGTRLQDRYARALYELADGAGAVDAVAADLTALGDAIASAPDFARALRNPVLGREGQGRALAAIAQKLGMGALTQKFLRLVAHKGRQAALPAIVAAYHAIVAARRGEMLAIVRSAAPLSDAQQQALARELGAKHKAKVTLQVTVDPALLGGFSAQVGATLYDRTISSQLNSLMQKLKEAA